MSQTLNLKIKGLWTHPNQFSEVPEGALNRADNIVIDRESIAQTRRGQKTYGSQFDDPVDQLFIYKNKILTHAGSKFFYDSDNQGTFVQYTGTFDQPDIGFKIRSFEANRNFYVTTSEGIKKLDSIDGQFRPAGAPGGLDGTYTLVSSSGFLTDQKSVAYRMVWGYKDANSNEIIGAPSQRLIALNNSGSSREVSMTWVIPDQITESWFYRIYRSNESANLTTEPDDELQLVKEGNPSTSDISNGEFSVIDSTPNSLKGATLYTSQSVQGIAQANEPPPFAKDVTIYKGYTLYGNTRSKQSYIMSLLAVGDDDLNYYDKSASVTSGLAQITGLTSQSSLVIDDLTYTSVQSNYLANDISIAYIGGAVAGSEVVTVTANNIVIQIEDGVSTATQVKAAFDASAPAVALASVAITGTGSNPQDIVTNQWLEGGFDTSVLDVGMRVKGTGIQSDSRILTIDSASQVTLTKSGTATGSPTLQFQHVIRVAGQEYFASNAPNLSDREFKVTSSGTPSQNITDTTLDLISLINKNPSNTTVYAKYLSGFDDLPGKLVIQERTIGGSDFILTSTSGQSFSPELPKEYLITSVSIASPTVVTSSNHGLSNSDKILVISSDSTPTINGVHIVSDITTNTFEIPVDVTVAGTVGSFIRYSEIAISTNEVKQNRICISKFQQPEAVPLLQNIDIGSADAPIRRVLALRDSVFVLKTDGIFRITGESPSSFSVELFDSTAIIKAPESAVIFNNQIFTFSLQGVIALGNEGAGIISRPIEKTLLELSTEEYTNFETATFAVSYESDRKYILFTVSSVGDSTATQAFVYNSLTDTWTRWTLSRNAGLVNPRDNKLYFSGPLDYIYQERKTLTRNDYADEEYALTISSYAGTTVTVNSTSDVEEGYTLKQGYLESKVLEVVNATTLVISQEEDWTAGSALVFKPIVAVLEWVPNTASNPGILKHYRETTLFFTDAAFSSIELGFQTNFSKLFETIPIVPTSTFNEWGNFEWGDGLWGGGYGGQQGLRSFIPLEKTRASWINFRISCEEAFSSFSLSGISVQFESMSERFK